MRCLVKENFRKSSSVEFVEVAGDFGKYCVRWTCCEK